ncbi:hypothetical protein Tcan_11091 [Toxocara canis]|uniref:Uncharacterized protein n=1 Tax=Toxocara canis TaxID=6265 RepID=A0A0B2VB44_TOXCA|nr:hypothetical protein Tcan_11091 [Toxocara canis]
MVEYAANLEQTVEMIVICYCAMPIIKLSNISWTDVGSRSAPTEYIGSPPKTASGVVFNAKCEKTRKEARRKNGFKEVKEHPSPPSREGSSFFGSKTLSKNQLFQETVQDDELKLAFVF